MANDKNFKVKNGLDVGDTTTITSSGTIGLATVGNGYLQITDETNTLAFDPNEIYGTLDLNIGTADGDIDLRPSTGAIKVYDGTNEATLSYTKIGQWDSAYSSLANYLPLAGGTMTGNLGLETALNPKLQLKTTDTTIATGQVISTVEFIGAIGAGSTTAGHIQQVATEDWTTGAVGSDMVFSINAGNSFDEKLRLNSDGVEITGTITATNYNATNWDTAYTYSQVGHLPLAGGALTGALTGTNITAGGYLRAASFLYTENDLLVRNAADDGWNTWGTRTAGNYNLSVGTISVTGALTGTSATFVKQISANGIVYPLTIAATDVGNTVDQVVGDGVGLQFKLADDAVAGGSFLGASIAATRVSATDTDSETSLDFYVSNNDETLDKSLTLGSALNAHFRGQITQSSGSIGAFGNVTAGLGHVKSQLGYLVGTTTVIDSSRNLTNIGTISSGAITTTGGVTINSATAGISRNRENEDGVPLETGLSYFAFNHNTSTHPLTEFEFDNFQKNSTTSFNEHGTWDNSSAFTLSSDAYYVEFHGYLYIDTTGTYQFGVNADDAVDLYIDGQRVADDYGGHGATAFFNDSSSSIYLVQGYHKLWARFEEVGGGDSCQLGWNGGSGSTLTAIPSGNLFRDARDDFKAYDGTIYGVGNLELTGNISSGVITATGGNSTNWNTAYGWGDHSSAGYTSGSFLPLSGGTLTGALSGTSATFVKQISANGIVYPLTIEATDVGNTVDQVIGDGVGLQFKLADDAVAGGSFLGASIAATRVSATDTDSETSLDFYVSNNDETLDKSLTLGSALNAHFRGQITQSSGSIGAFGNVTAGLGHVKSQLGYLVGTTTVIDSSRNLTNIGTISSGAITTTGDLSLQGNLLLTGDATATNAARTIDFTGFDKEGATDFTDRAYIQHTTNTGGHAGSVLVISSQNDAGDGIAFQTNASSELKHNSNTIWTAGNLTNNQANWNTAYGWGNHASAGYLTSYTDTNTTYSAGNGIALSGTTFSLAKTKRWTPADQGNLSTYPIYYKVGVVNKGNGGLHLKGSLNNHVENFGSCDFDLSILGREGGTGTDIEVQGSLNVGYEGTGILIVKSTDTGTYHNYDVYIALTRYSQVTVDLTPEGNTAVLLPTAGTTTKPTAIGGIAAEFDTIAKTEGSYVVSNSSIYNNYHSGVFTNNSANWNTAYGWGDHSSAGYASGSFLPLSGGTLTGALSGTSATFVEQISANGIVYPLTIEATDVGNTVDQVIGDGVGLQFKLADDAVAGGSFLGASIAATRVSDTDSDSDTSLDFYVSNNDETLDKSLTLGSALNAHFRGQITQSSGSITAFGNVIAGLGHVKSQIGYLVGTTTVIDSSRNLTNIGTIYSTKAGNNTSGGNVQLGLTSNDTTKWTALTATQYAHSSESEGYSLITGTAGSSSSNRVIIGGGLDEQNAATQVEIRTAANATTRNGTEIVRISNAAGLDVRNNNIKITGTTVIDSSRNLTNIGTISSGIITATGGTLTGNLGLETALNPKLQLKTTDTTITTGQVISTVEFIGAIGAGSTTAGHIQQVATEDWTTGAVGSDMVFSINAGNSFDEKLRLNSEGVEVTGSIALSQNTVGTTYGNGVSATPTDMISQVVGDNDGWRLYGEAPATNDIKVIFEVVDDIETGDTWVFRNKKTYSPFTATEPFKISGVGNVTALGTVTATGGAFSGHITQSSGSITAFGNVEAGLGHVKSQIGYLVGTTTVIDSTGRFKLGTTSQTTIGLDPGGTAGSMWIAMGAADKSFAVSDGNVSRFIISGASGGVTGSGTIESRRQHKFDPVLASTSDATATMISKGSVTTTTGYQPQNWHMAFQDGGGTVRGKITSSHYSTQYSTSSDYRLKEDIQPIANATARLLAIEAVNFRWIDGQQRSDGFIAHELQEHLPEAVTGTKDATEEVTETIVAEDGTESEVTRTIDALQGVDQSKLVPLLVKTIQELEARITALENA